MFHRDGILFNYVFFDTSKPRQPKNQAGKLKLESLRSIVASHLEFNVPVVGSVEFIISKLDTHAGSNLKTITFWIDQNEGNEDPFYKAMGVDLSIGVSTCWGVSPLDASMLQLEFVGNDYFVLPLEVLMGRNMVN